MASWTRWHAHQSHRQGLRRAPPLPPHCLSAHEGQLQCSSTCLTLLQLDGAWRSTAIEAATGRVMMMAGKVRTVALTMVITAPLLLLHGPPALHSEVGGLRMMGQQHHPLQ